MPTEITSLQQPLKDGAIRTVNFFNGRLLTGADLSREQQARREADAKLGSALGDGIAWGLKVAVTPDPTNKSPPVATITPGIAVNRLGATLAVSQTITLALDRTAPPDTSSVACLFGDCAPAPTGGYAHGTGLYVLTIAPAFTTEGRAQLSGMGDVTARCAVDATVEGVQFRLLLVDTQVLKVDFAEPDPASPGAFIPRRNLRNMIAYRCFGDGVKPGWPADLLGQTGRQDDLLETLRAYDLEDQEVPLAVIAFDAAGRLLFADMWAARRMLETRDSEPVWAALSEPRRATVGRAMFRQFQREIEETDPAGLVARDRFAWLPPAGFLPNLTDAQVATFFTGLTVRGPVHIDASAVEPLLRMSLAAPAIDTSSPHALFFYRIAQTRMARDTGQSVADIAFFASGHLPYRGDARFNLNHFDYANYALIP